MLLSAATLRTRWCAASRTILLSGVLLNYGLTGLWLLMPHCLRRWNSFHAHVNTRRLSVALGARVLMRPSAGQEHILSAVYPRPRERRFRKVVVTRLMPQHLPVIMVAHSASMQKPVTTPLLGTAWVSVSCTLSPMDGFSLSPEVSLSPVVFNPSALIPGHLRRRIHCTPLLAARWLIYCLLWLWRYRSKPST